CITLVISVLKPPFQRYSDLAVIHEHRYNCECRLANDSDLFPPARKSANPGRRATRAARPYRPWRTCPSSSWASPPAEPGLSCSPVIPFFFHPEGRPAPTPDGLHPQNLIPNSLLPVKTPDNIHINFRPQTFSAAAVRAPVPYAALGFP